MNSEGRQRLTGCGNLRLVIIHNHFRPGGVRRVIELATPGIVGELGRCNSAVEVVLVSAEMPEDLWLRNFAARVRPATVTCRIEQRAGYLEGRQWKRKATVTPLKGFLNSLFAGVDPGNCIFWAHNQSLGRNLALTEALTEVTSTGGARLVLHHHDWWFDNRWARWPEMRRGGYRTVRSVAETLFRSPSGVSHVAINKADF